MLQLKWIYACEFLKKENTQRLQRHAFFAWKKFEKKERTPHSPGHVCPEPYSFDCTPEEEKEFLECSFDADGIAKEQTGSMNGMSQSFHDGKKVSRL